MLAHRARKNGLSMRNTGWGACLPVHTFHLTGLKIAIIMDMFTEVRIHGHDKLQLSYISSELPRHEGVNGGANPGMNFSSRASLRIFFFFSQWINSKKKEKLDSYLVKYNLAKT